MEELLNIKYTADYWIIALPAIMALADILTGFLQAQINGTKNSSVMRKGLYRKTGELATIGLTWVVCIAVGLGNAIPMFSSLYVVLMEALSIFENLKSAGVPVPEFITKKAQRMADDVNNGNMNTQDKKE